MAVEGEARFIEEDFIVPLLALRQRMSRVSLFAASLALVVISVLLLGRQVWLAGFAAAVGMVFAFLGTWQSVGPRILGRQHLRGIAEDDLPVRFRFDEEGMTISGSWGTSFYRYRGIHAFLELRSSILVQTGPVLRMVVPKRAFSPEDRPKVVELLRARVEPRGSLPEESGRALLWRYVALWIGIILLLLIAAGVVDVAAWR